MKLFLVSFSLFVSFQAFLSANASGGLCLNNPDFGQWQEGSPEGWIVRTKQPLDKIRENLPSGYVSGLSVDIKNSEGGYGEILQKLTLEKNERYSVKGFLYGSEANLAFLQVKLYANDKEIDRISSARNGTHDWTAVEKSFTTEDADRAELLVRWKQGNEVVGNKVGFTGLEIEKLPPLVFDGEEVPPYAVPTFNSISLYWKPTGGTSNREVTVRYKVEGEAEWRQAMNLWFDDFIHEGRGLEHTAEYRGSIVYLEPGTLYDIELELENGPVRNLQVKTWSEDFKIARTVMLPESQDGAFVIKEGGSKEDGYVLYTMPEGVVWDAQNAFESNVRVEASWVILRGLTLKGASVHAIVLGDVTDVVIEDCDISGWGSTREDGQAYNIHSGIFSESDVLERIVVQDCRIHHPRSDSNSWNEKRPGTSSSHPQGPQGISFKRSLGNHVIRNNRFYSDMDHMFNDAMGEFANFGYGGFPNRDSDISGNFISHCWDDGIEAEGADMNVRVYDNYIDMTLGAIGAAAPSLGPLYIYRNVYAVSRKHSGTSSNDLRGHYLVKIGNERTQFVQGKIYIFHNTALQPPAFAEGKDISSGAQSGIVFTSSKKKQENITAWNNIFQMRKPSDWAIKDTQLTASNKYDYNLITGRTMMRDGNQQNGVFANPTYERAPDGRLWLVPGTPGHDQGVLIPNFNDDFTGEAPDMGATETYTTSAKPEMWPDFPENQSPVLSDENQG